ncbi:MAG TPA: MBOAT family protein [Vicinamibacteria bacterium]|nr:MBOAT family protein [Vicinamibacteria bacterium]
MGGLAWLVGASLGLVGVLALLRPWPSAMRVVGLVGCALPFALPLSTPLLRAGAALVCWLVFIKVLQYAAGHERPRGAVEFFQFAILPAVVRWDGPRRADLARFGRTAAAGVFQVAVALLLVWLVTSLDLRSPVELVTTQLGLYFALAGFANLAALSLSLRGLDYQDPFDNPLLSRTPSEFWGRRWNTWVNHTLYRYVFLPAGGRRRPARGIMAAFLVSGLFHDALVAAGNLRVTLWMTAFFLLQGLIVAVTSGSRGFRRLARRSPVLTWAVTAVLMLTTGVLLVRGADGIDPSRAWERCCR